jgi:hypothetical protein
VTDHIKTKDRDDADLNIAAEERAGVQYPLNHILNAAGAKIDPATEVTVAALLTAAQAIQAAAEALNTKTTAVNTGAIGGTVALDAGTLAALETINANIAGTVPVSIAGTVATSAASLPLPTGAATEATLATLAGLVHAEDSASADADPGLVVLVQRRDSDSTAVSNDGDYSTLKSDEEGRLKVSTKPASFALVSSNITANAQTAFCDVSRASNVMLHMVAASLVGHNATFEGSIDSTNGTDGAWFAIQVIRTNANTIELTTGVLAATPAYAWEASVNGLSFVRVRATAHTSGTATWKFQRGSYATEPIPAAQISGTQPVSGTVTVTSTRITPNAADGHSSHYHLISAGSTNDTLVLTGARAIGLITATNINAAARYLKLYNKATAPTSADTPVMTILLPPGQTTVIGGNSPIRLPLGIGIRLTTGIAVADTGAVAVAEHSVSIAYT